MKPQAHLKNQSLQSHFILSFNETIYAGMRYKQLHQLMRQQKWALILQADMFCLLLYMHVLNACVCEKEAQLIKSKFQS